MKIFVCVKQAASLDDDFEVSDDGRTVDADALEWNMNEWDTFALEAALQIREGRGDGEVIAVTVGDEEADEVLLDCLARNADRAIRIADDDHELTDVLQVARLLAAVVEREQPDLVLCGVQSSDSVNGATGVALAGYVDLPHVAVARAIEIEGDGSAAVVNRELEGGLVERVRVRMPAVLTVQTGINEPRYATLRAIKQARDKPRSVVTPADLGLEGDLRPGARVEAIAPPTQREGAEMLEGDVDAIAGQIAEIVSQRMGVGA